MYKKVDKEKSPPSKKNGAQIEKKIGNMCGGRESNLGPQLLQVSTLHATNSTDKKLHDKRCFGQIFNLFVLMEMRLWE